MNMQYPFTTKKTNILPDLISDEEEDDEEVYKMAGVMAQCGGLECMLNRLSGIKDFKQGRHLLTVSKHLFWPKAIYDKSLDIYSIYTFKAYWNIHPE